MSEVKVYQIDELMALREYKTNIKVFLTKKKKNNRNKRNAENEPTSPAEFFVCYFMKDPR